MREILMTLMALVALSMSLYMWRAVVLHHVPKDDTAPADTPHLDRMSAHHKGGIRR